MRHREPRVFDWLVFLLLLAAAGWVLFLLSAAGLLLVLRNL